MGIIFPLPTTASQVESVQGGVPVFCNKMSFEKFQNWKGSVLDDSPQVCLSARYPVGTSLI